MSVEQRLKRQAQMIEHLEAENAMLRASHSDTEKDKLIRELNLEIDRLRHELFSINECKRVSQLCGASKPRWDDGRCPVPENLSPSEKEKWERLIADNVKRLAKVERDRKRNGRLAWEKTKRALETTNRRIEQKLRERSGERANRFD